MRKLALLAIFLALPLTGCHVTASTPPTAPLLPGAANSFDQVSYETLIGIQTSINSLKASIAANPTLSVLTPAVNQAITDYNLAEVAWQVEHSASTVANQTSLTNALTKIQTDVTTLTKAVK